MDISQSEFLAVSEAATPKRQSGQFCHVATYARRVSAMHSKPQKISAVKKPREKAPVWSVSDISKEAARSDPNHFRHVPKPMPPTLLCGRDVTELEAICEEVATSGKQSNGKALRADTHVLLAAVYSIDVRGSDYEENKERCDKFLADSIAWHAKMYGEVVCAVSHQDEGYFHGHVYSASTDARGMIPGWRAKREAIKLALDEGKDQNEANKAGNLAFKKAMVEVQDSYFFEVGSVNGLARYGNRRMRYQPGSGESTTKKREREAFAAREIAMREQDEINRKKLAEDVAEQERNTAESARELAEIKAEKSRIREAADMLNSIQNFSDEREFYVDNQIQNLLKTPEFVKDEKARETEKALEIANEKIESLKQDIKERDSYIDRLLKTVSQLKAKIKTLLEKII